MIKVVLTAAGKGTRLLPYTKEMPKEMMPIFTKTHNNQRSVIPLLQYIFEQFYSMKIRDFCFVVGRDKRSIKDHFALHQSYLNELSVNRKTMLNFFSINSLVSCSTSSASISINLNLFSSSHSSFLKSLLIERR